MSCNCSQGQYYKKTGLKTRAGLLKPEQEYAKELTKKKKTSKKEEDAVIETEALEDKPKDIEIR